MSVNLTGGHISRDSNNLICNTTCHYSLRRANLVLFIWSRTYTKTPLNYIFFFLKISYPTISHFHRDVNSINKIRNVKYWIISCRGIHGSIINKKQKHTKLIDFKISKSKQNQIPYTHTDLVVINLVRLFSYLPYKVK